MADAPVIPASTQAAIGDGKPVAAVAPVAPKPGTPEHDAAMIAKVDAAAAAAANPQPTPAEPARPEWLPEKFKTVEDMAKAYGELEKKQSAPVPVVPPVVVDPAKPAAVDANKLEIPAADKAAADAVQSAGLDMGKLQTEFAEKGELSAESLATLDKAGIPKAMVDAYIEGREAVSAQYDAEAFTAAGGQESYTKMVTWAKSGLPAPEQKAFNDAVVSGDKARMTMAVTSLKSKFETAFGTDPELVKGGTVADAGQVYESMAQMTEDMKNPLYRKDPAFRAKVMAKADRSNFGTIVNRA